MQWQQKTGSTDGILRRIRTVIDAKMLLRTCWLTSVITVYNEVMIQTSRLAQNIKCHGLVVQSWHLPFCIVGTISSDSMLCLCLQLSAEGIMFSDCLPVCLSIRAWWLVFLAWYLNRLLEGISPDLQFRCTWGQRWTDFEVKRSRSRQNIPTKAYRLLAHRQKPSSFWKLIVACYSSLQKCRMLVAVDDVVRLSVGRNVHKPSGSIY